MTPIGGVVPAHLLPFTADLEIDEPSLRAHLAWLLAQPIGGITTTAHASEVAACSRAERRRVIEIVADVVAARVPVIAGVYADATREAVAVARDAAAAGADALLLFPSPLFAEDGGPDEEVVFRHFAAVAEAVDLPLVIFQYSRSTRCHYPPPLLARLCEEVPAVVAVKEWSLDMLDFQRSLDVLAALDRPVAMLSSFSSALLPTLVLGADGVLSGHGSVVADLHCDLVAAVRDGQQERAREIDLRLRGLTRVAYAPPFQNAHNRMKYALHALYRIGGYAVRPPLLPLSDRERAVVRASLVEAGLLESAPAVA